MTEIGSYSYMMGLPRQSSPPCVVARGEVLEDLNLGLGSGLSLGCSCEPLQLVAL